MELDHYIRLMDSEPVDDPAFSAKMWDNRARFWEKERKNARKDDERVVSALAYLKERGVLIPDCAVADLGCGPGRFAVAFAREAGNVLGMDISREMVSQGSLHARELGLTNVTFRQGDFHTLDLEAEGYRKAFHLVFASLTPAVRGFDSLRKMMEMSGKWCMTINHLSGRNYLRERISREVFGRELPQHRTGRWFYALFNVLYLSGFDPETSYFTRRKELRVTPEDDYVSYLMEHLLPHEEHTAENAGRIRQWLQENAGEDDTLMDISDATYGRILLDVTKRTSRPDYTSIAR